MPVEAGQGLREVLGLGERGEIGGGCAFDRDAWYHKKASVSAQKVDGKQGLRTAVALETRIDSVVGTPGSWWWRRR